jgi:hypothetical protein
VWRSNRSKRSKPIWAALGVASCVAASCVYASGPADFGMAELNAAIAARNLKFKPKIVAELNTDPPETFRIDPYSAGGGRVSGGDLRGLMYGLLEAAAQMRTLGHLKLARASPFLSPRGVKANADPSVSWFGSEDFWRAYFAVLARDRFDRLQLVFDRFPDRDSFPALRTISQIAMQYGVDIALGLRSFSPESHSALQDLLTQSTGIRSVVLVGASEPEKFPILDALAKTGRRVVLDGNRLWQIDPAQAGPDEESIRSAVSSLTGGFEVASSLGSQAVGLWGRLGYDPTPPKPPPSTSTKSPPPTKRLR